MGDETQKTDETVVDLNPGAEAAESETEMQDLSQDELDSEPTLEQQLLAKEAEALELKDKLLRTLAEADNVRKRSERQVSEARLYAVESFARDLLEVSDNLSRALDALTDEKRAELSPEGKSLLEGVEMTQKSLHAIFARNKVVAIDAGPGAAFDPNVHQAVAQIPSDQPSGSVAEPFQSGWKIGERTLRAAMVAVSTGKAN
ncbi:MAG: nucleotide exchange factor GrpE [Pseudomonadota bacterium]